MALVGGLLSPPPPLFLYCFSLVRNDTADSVLSRQFTCHRICWSCLAASMVRVIILADAPLEHLHWARALQRAGRQRRVLALRWASFPLAGSSRPSSSGAGWIASFPLWGWRGGMGRTATQAFLSPTAAACPNRLGSGECVKASSMKSNEAISQGRRRKHWPLRSPARSDQSRNPIYVGGSDCHMQD